MIKDWRSIPYVEIIKKSWKVAIQNRYLWWLGFFVSLPEIFRINYSFRNDAPTDWENIASKYAAGIANFIQNQGGSFWIILIGILVAVFIFFLILNFIGQGGLIDLTLRIRKGETGSFRDGLNAGMKHLKKIASISLAVGAAVFIVFVVMIIPVLILFFKEIYLLGILFLLIALAILVPLWFISFFLKNFGYIYAVSGRLNFFASFENAYNLLRKNWKSSLIMSLFFIPLGLAFFASVLAFVFSLSASFLIIGVISWYLAGQIAVYFLAGLGILALLVGLAVIKSAYTVLSQTIWILFFAEIATHKEKEAVLEMAPEKTRKARRKKAVKPEPAPAPTPTISKIDE